MSIPRVRGPGSIRPLWAALPALVASCMGSEAPKALDGPVRLADVGIEAELGADLDPEGDPLALLRRPKDAFLEGDHVFVLDGDPPWVRVFARDGTFLEGQVPEGDGPGEARFPSSLIPTPDGGYVLNHPRGVSVYDGDGRLEAFIPRRYQRTSGALVACGGAIIVAALDDELPRTLIAEMNSDGLLVDTLLVVPEARLNSRSYHGWLARPTDEGILLYPEDSHVDHVVELTCDGCVARDITVDSLGPPASMTRPTPDQVTVTTPRPPFPAGLARLRDDVLWVTQQADTTTLVTAIGPDDRRRRLVLEGWYHLLDADPDGTLLFSNRYLVSAVWGVVPEVFLVDGDALLRMLDGVPGGHAPRRQQPR